MIDPSKPMELGVKIGLEGTSQFTNDAKAIQNETERSTSALRNLRQEVADLNRTFEAYNKTSSNFEAMREDYRRHHGRNAPLENTVYSSSAEEVERENLRRSFERRADLINQMIQGNPALEGTAPARMFERLAEQGVSMYGGTKPQTAELRDLSTEGLRAIIDRNLENIKERGKKASPDDYQDLQPFIQSYQGKLAQEKRGYVKQVIEEEAKYQGLAPEEQLRYFDEYNRKVVTAQENISRITKTQREFNETVADLAGSGHKSLPAYLGTLINMGVSIGQGYANIKQAEALAFDFGSPIGMASAKENFEIYKRKQMFTQGGKFVGNVLGAGIGVLTGMNPFMTSYIGGELVGGVGSITATLMNTQPKVDLKYLQEMYGRSQAVSNAYGQFQTATYSTARASGLSPTDSERIAQKYAEMGLAPSQTLGLIQQYVSINGGFDEAGFNDFIRFYMETGTTPAGAGSFARLTGRNGVSVMRGIGMRMGITESDVAKFSDLQQFFGANTSLAGTQFTGATDIARASSFMSSMPLMLYGNNLPEFAQRIEGMQQIRGGFSALATAKSPAEQAFLFSALGKGRSFQDTILRMREGILGRGNLADILSAIPAGQEANYLMALTEGKNVNTGVLREMMEGLGGDREGFIKRVRGMEGEGKSISEMFGGLKVSQAEKIGARQAMTDLDAGRQIYSTFSEALLNFNQEVNKKAKSAEVQTRIAEMYVDVINSVREAFVTNGMIGRNGERSALTSGTRNPVSSEKSQRAKVN